MSATTSIEWTDLTWNPVTGCDRITSGCENCYAFRFAGRRTKGYEDGLFRLTLRPERLTAPLAFRRGSRVFVNSMSDLHHKDVPDHFLDEIYDTMEWSSERDLTFQCLTKRSSLMRDYVNSRYAAAPAPRHIWLGVSIEDGSASSMARVRHLQETNASVRFLSIEPMLNSISALPLNGIQWVIVGGESGPGWRAMDPDWVRSVRDQCHRAGVAFFFKQWAGLRPKTLGRVLDGRTWDEFPT